MYEVWAESKDQICLEETDFFWKNKSRTAQSWRKLLGKYLFLPVFARVFAHLPLSTEKLAWDAENSLSFEWHSTFVPESDLTDCFFLSICLFELDFRSKLIALLRCPLLLFRGKAEFLDQNLTILTEIGHFWTFFSLVVTCDFSKWVT